MSKKIGEKNHTKNSRDNYAQNGFLRTVPSIKPKIHSTRNYAQEIHVLRIVPARCRLRRKVAYSREKNAAHAANAGKYILLANNKHTISYKRRQVANGGVSASMRLHPRINSVRAAIIRP